MDNIQYCYLRAKIAVLEELLAEQGESVESAVSASAGADVRLDDADRAYKVLIADLVGMVFDADGQADCREVAAYIKSQGGEFHFSSVSEAGDLEKGKVCLLYTSPSPRD